MSVKFFIAAFSGLVTGELVENALVYVAGMRRESARAWGFLAAMSTGAVSGALLGALGGAVAGGATYAFKKAIWG